MRTIGGGELRARLLRCWFDYVFRETGIIRLFASVYEYNPASMKVLEKVGFTRQAILRDAAIKNGRVIDMYYYDLIKREIWESVY